MTDGNGIQIDAYEWGAGSSLTTAGTGHLEANEATHEAMQNMPRMGTLQKDWIRMWDTLSGNGVACHFGIVTGWSKWGNWGLMCNMFGDSCVKYDSVVSMMSKSAIPAAVAGYVNRLRPAQSAVGAPRKLFDLQGRIVRRRSGPPPSELRRSAFQIYVLKNPNGIQKIIINK
jgi:hypothetical protein